MAAGFTVLDNEARFHFGSTSQNTTATITPAVGDIVLWFAENSVNSGADAAVSGGGMTWTLVDEIREASDISTLFVFRATAGTPSAGVLTLSATDNWSSTTYAIVRPVDLTYVGIAGSDTSNNAGVGSLTISLTTSDPGGLLGYVATDQQETIGTDTGWTELFDENIADGNTHALQYRLSDDTEWVADIDSAFSRVMFGVVLEFDAVAAGSAVAGGVPTHQHVHNPTRNVTVFMRERFRRAGDLFVPDTRLLVHAGASR